MPMKTDRVPFSRIALSTRDSKMPVQLFPFHLCFFFFACFGIFNPGSVSGQLPNGDFRFYFVFFQEGIKLQAGSSDGYNHHPMQQVTTFHSPLLLPAMPYYVFHRVFPAGTKPLINNLVIFIIKSFSFLFQLKHFSCCLVFGRHPRLSG